MGRQLKFDSIFGENKGGKMRLSFSFFGNDWLDDRKVVTVKLINGDGILDEDNYLIEHDEMIVASHNDADVVSIKISRADTPDSIISTNDLLIDLV